MGQAGAVNLRRFLMSDACRDSSGSTCDVVKNSRYWAVKEYKEMVNSLRQSSMGFISNDYLDQMYISSSCSAKMYECC